MSEFYIIIARKIFPPFSGGGEGGARVPPAPVSYTYACFENPSLHGRRSSVNFRGYDIFARKICMKN